MMKQTEINALYEYLLNRFTYLEQDVQQLQQNIRYRRIDAIDCLELCLALERLQAFNQFSAEVRALLLRDYEKFPRKKSPLDKSAENGV